MTTIGIIGSGNIGSTVAKLAVDAGYDVVAGQFPRGPETLADLVAQLGPKARAATAAEAGEAADIAVVTIPLKNYLDIPAAPLAGKVVLDTINYYPERDGAVRRAGRRKRPRPASWCRTIWPTRRSSRASTTSSSSTSPRWPVRLGRERSQHVDHRR